MFPCFRSNLCSFENNLHNLQINSIFYVIIFIHFYSEIPNEFQIRVNATQAFLGPPANILDGELCNNS